MKIPRILSRSAYLFGLAIGCSLVLLSVRAQPAAGSNEQVILETNTVPVDVLPPGAQDWVNTKERQILRPGHRVRTSPHGRATLRWSDNSVVPLGPMTEVEILAPHATDAESGLQLFRGVLSFFHREKPGRIRIIARGTVAGIRGTEFILAIDPQTERITFFVVEGEVGITNAQGFLVLSNNEQGMVDVGQAPQKTLGFIVNKVLQWAFYYPAVLDLRELPLTGDEEAAIDSSLAAYRAGDLIAALTNYPGTRLPAASASERIYYAA